MSICWSCLSPTVSKPVQASASMVVQPGPPVERYPLPRSAAEGTLRSQDPRAPKMASRLFCKNTGSSMSSPPRQIFPGLDQGPDGALSPTAVKNRPHRPTCKPHATWAFSLYRTATPEVHAFNSRWGWELRVSSWQAQRSSATLSPRVVSVALPREHDGR